jgi:hypothetical protein
MPPSCFIFGPVDKARRCRNGRISKNLPQRQRIPIHSQQVEPICPASGPAHPCQETTRPCEKSELPTLFRSHCKTGSESRRMALNGAGNETERKNLRFGARSCHGRRRPPCRGRILGGQRDQPLPVSRNATPVRILACVMVFIDTCA